jgi:hypothetical protein
MPFREFIVHRSTAGAAPDVYIVRLHSLPDCYLATASLVGAGGKRVPVQLLDEPKIQAPPAHFFQHRRAYGRELAMRITQALQEGRATPLPDGEQAAMSIGANLAGYPGGHPDAQEDDLTDWSDAFDLEHAPFRMYRRELPKPVGMLPGCTVVLVSTLGGYTMRVHVDLIEPHRIWGSRMPLIALQPWRESVDAAGFFQNRTAHRDRLAAMVDEAVAASRFSPISDYPGEYNGIEDFDWFIQANLDPDVWPGGYPQAVMDDLSDWVGPQRAAT